MGGGREEKETRKRGSTCDSWVAGKLRQLWLSHASTTNTDSSQPSRVVGKKRCGTASGSEPRKRLKK